METVCQVVSQLPPGFRFQPTDQELIIHYLRKKVDASQAPAPTIIADIDLYKFNPWELPEKALFGEGEWFFFSPRDRKYPNGGRPNRATASGYWKATGTDKPILATGDNRCLGVKKALVFYKGQPRKGVKTNWLMHEYRLLDSGNHSLFQRPKGSMRLDDWVLCRVRLKGSSAAESNGPTEKLCSPQTNTEKQEIMKQQVAEERSSPAEWSEAQLLGYLLGSLEGAEESSDAGSMRSSGTTFCQNSECYSVAQQDSPPHAVESALSSIKRKLSFTVLDELILMQPGNKRQQFWVGGQPSPTVSDSVNQEFDEPFVFY